MKDANKIIARIETLLNELRAQLANGEREELTPKDLFFACYRQHGEPITPNMLTNYAKGHGVYLSNAHTTLQRMADNATIRRLSTKPIRYEPRESAIPARTHL